MTVLAVTRSDDDEAVERVTRALARRGATLLRLDTDRFPDAVSVSTRVGPSARATGGRPAKSRAPGVARTLTTPEGRFDLDDVSAVWHRRFHAGGALPVALDDLRDACVGEARRALHGMIAALPCPHVDAIEAVRRCDHKELQLVRAAALGLAVPRTLLSNEPGAVRAFYDACDGDIVTKVQSSFAVVRQDAEHVVFTSRVARHHLDDLGGLRMCPMTFQERVDKALDVRATVVGDRVFAAAVDAGGLLDWREEGVALLHAWRPHRLPRDVERGLLALVHELGLRYGAADFVVTPAGEHFFLEVNAGGEWLWLDDLLGIAGALAAELAP